MKKYTLELTEQELKMIKLGLIDRSLNLQEDGFNDIAEEYEDLFYKLYNLQSKEC